MTINDNCEKKWYVHCSLTHADHRRQFRKYGKMPYAITRVAVDNKMSKRVSDTLIHNTSSSSHQRRQARLRDSILVHTPAKSSSTSPLTSVITLPFKFRSRTAARKPTKVNGIRGIMEAAFGVMSQAAEPNA